MTTLIQAVPSPSQRQALAYDPLLDDVGFMTCMTLVLLGNYAQTGHLGGPLAYTPYNVAAHLIGPENGGLRSDYRRPKHPYSDKFMLAAGHSIPTCYALWMIMGQALYRKYQQTGDPRYRVDPQVAMLPIDALGFRRSAGALKTLLHETDLEDHPLFAQAKGRGIRALMGHAESTDVTNDVNGGPSGIGIATAAGKAAFWDVSGAPESPKVIALEGEFALTEGHAQELKTQALALQVGKRLRVMISDNNAGIDDRLIGGVIAAQFDGYDLVSQWTSYGWNVFTMANGNDYGEVAAVLKAMDEVDPHDRRPIAAIGKTIKGYWPAAVDGKIPGYGDQLVSYPSHPYALKMNSEYFLALAQTFEKHYGVEFEGIRKGAISNNRERLIQFKTNIDVVMSLLDRNGLGDRLADRLVEIGDTVRDDVKLRISASSDPFLDDRLRVAALPEDAQKVSIRNAISGAEKQVSIALFKKSGEVAGARRAISEIIKWMNYVTDGRFFTIAADLSESINVEHGSLWGHYSPKDNPLGTRLKAPIQEAGNVSTAIGLVSQSASVDPQKFAGVWALSGTWKLFPRGQAINLSFWDYNDVAPGYFAAAEIAARDPRVGIITLEVARPDFAVADRNHFADTDLRAAAKGLYVIRDFAPGKPRHGFVIAQGSSSTVNLVKVLPKLDAAGVNVKVIAAISEELFDRQPQAYRDSVLPPQARYDLMVVSTGTRRVWPLRNLGPLTDEYSLTSDFDNTWRSGGLEADVIAEAHLDPDSIFAGVERFANERERRIGDQRKMIG